MTTNFLVENHGTETEHLKNRDSTSTLHPEQGIQSTGHDTPVLSNPEPGPIKGYLRIYPDLKQSRTQAKVHEMITKAYARLEPLVPKDANDPPDPSEGLKDPSIKEVCNFPEHSFHHSDKISVLFRMSRKSWDNQQLQILLDQTLLTPIICRMR